MGKLFGKQLQKVQRKLAPCHNGYVKLENEDVLPSDVPKGSFVVYVGDEMHRFVVKTKILRHHLFQSLLAKSAEEFGHNPNGGLIMDCDVSFFKNLIWVIESGKPSIWEHQIVIGFFGRLR